MFYRGVRVAGLAARLSTAAMAGGGACATAAGGAVAPPLVVLWFRGNDLRLHDNSAVAFAAAEAKRLGAGVIPVFSFDQRWFAGGRLTGAVKTGPYRARFLYEAVSDLKQNLRQVGSDLHVTVEAAEDAVARALEGAGKGSLVVGVGEVTSEEIAAEAAVRRAAKLCGASLVLCEGSSLMARSELPFSKNLNDMPGLFTSFRKKVEAACTVPRPRDSPLKGDLPAVEGKKAPPLPPLQAVPGMSESSAQDVSQDPRGVMKFKGGESVALARLKYYVWESEAVADYFNTRNGMLGADYSTKFSPWLSHGCLSPRLIHHEIARYEQSRGANKSTYWVTFELLWRDYLRFFAEKYGTRMFHEGGIIGARQKWTGSDALLQRWKDGKTGMPLVDANMRELKYTGFMSNRGRQNVASYLIFDLGVDWRLGAEHFESLLLDHDVCSNWGNWVAAAGLTGNRVNRFNIVKQSRDYDPSGDYVRHWLPELKDVPTQYVHEPFKMSLSVQETSNCVIGRDYPAPEKSFSSSVGWDGTKKSHDNWNKGKSKGKQKHDRGNRGSGRATSGRRSEFEMYG